MKIIGLTGQTGAGKSTVCKALEKNGYFHIDADKVYWSLLSAGSPLLQSLKNAFGDDILFPDGMLNKKVLAKKAFSSPQNTELLSKITHPSVIGEINRIIKSKETENYSGILIDAIGLFESGANELCDYTVAIVAPNDIRLKRIVKRDNISEADALLRINAQKDEKFFKENADFVLRNYPPYNIDDEIKRIFKI